MVRSLSKTFQKIWSLFARFKNSSNLLAIFLKFRTIFFLFPSSLGPNPALANLSSPTPDAASTQHQPSYLASPRLLYLLTARAYLQVPSSTSSPRRATPCPHARPAATAPLLSQSAPSCHRLVISVPCHSQCHPPQRLHRPQEPMDARVGTKPCRRRQRLRSDRISLFITFSPKPNSMPP